MTPSTATPDSRPVTQGQVSRFFRWAPTVVAIAGVVIAFLVANALRGRDIIDLQQGLIEVKQDIRDIKARDSEIRCALGRIEGALGIPRPAGPK